MLQVVYNHTLSRQQKIYDRRTKHLSYVEKLLNKLLAEDEIIFISIDDKEADTLHMV